MTYNLLHDLQFDIYMTNNLIHDLQFDAWLTIWYMIYSLMHD